MPRPKSKSPKERHHVHLNEGDWERLTELYKPQGIGPSAVIAKLVSFHLRRVDEKANLLASTSVSALSKGDVLEGMDSDE